MKLKTSLLTASALCLGWVVSSGFAGGPVGVHKSGVGVQLTTASTPVTLACTHGVRVSATKMRPGYVEFPSDHTKFICNLWTYKNKMPVLVTDYGFRVYHGEHPRVKIYSAGLPQYDNSKMIYLRPYITWGNGAQIHFIDYGVKSKYSTYKKIQ